MVRSYQSLPVLCGLGEEYLCVRASHYCYYYYRYFSTTAVVVVMVVVVVPFTSKTVPISLSSTLLMSVLIPNT